MSEPEAEPGLAPFAGNLRRLRALTGASEMRLALAAGVSASVVNRLEHGSGSVSMNAAERVAAALGSSLRDMLAPGHAESLARGAGPLPDPLSSPVVSASWR